MKRLASFTLLANSIHRNKQFNHSVGKSKAPLEYFSLPQSYTQKGATPPKGLVWAAASGGWKMRT
jgi:hypothetical protein